jgi:cyclophilin family peptidyl-prolyl cis-trans isomerase
MIVFLFSVGYVLGDVESFNVYEEARRRLIQFGVPDKLPGREEEQELIYNEIKTKLNTRLGGTICMSITSHHPSISLVFIIIHIISLLISLPINDLCYETLYSSMDWCVRTYIYLKIFRVFREQEKRPQ